MLAAPGKNALDISSRGTPSGTSKLPLEFESQAQSVNNSVDRISDAGSSATRHGFLMECAANPGRRETCTLDETECKGAERISQCVFRPFQRGADFLGDVKPKPKGSAALSLSLPPLVTYPPTATIMPTANTVPHNSRKATPVHLVQDASKMSPNLPPMFFTPQMGRVMEFGTDFRAMCEHIWRYNDQKTSLYLQERLKCCVPGEYEQLFAAICENFMPLMVHQFGNFLVQCMLQLAKPNEVVALAKLLEGHIAELAKNQFCCHVIQRLLDVSSVVIQATIASELLDDVVDTMCSASGTHVWQKLLHLPWKYGMPPITLHAHNAVHHPPNKHGWLTIAKTEAGCATIKSFLGVSSAGPERQQCLDELVGSFHNLITDPIGRVLAARIANDCSKPFPSPCHHIF